MNKVITYTLRAGGHEVSILNFGCITNDWRVPLGGSTVPIVLGYADPSDHLRHPRGYKGVIAGRFANRIKDASFELDGQRYQLAANEGPNQLHGGPDGIAHRFWQITQDDPASLTAKLHSDDGDQGFPGAVDFTVQVTLAPGQLRYRMLAIPDRPTPINMAQHNYYNLMGAGDIRDHHLRLAASAYTPVDDAMIPTGEIRAVEGSALDLRKPRRIGDVIKDIPLDTNFLLDGPAPAATLSAPNGLGLSMTTDQPGIQVYDGHGLSPRHAPLGGQTHGPCAGLCLEPQYFPDSPNQPTFPSAIFTPDRPYRQDTIINVTGPA